MKEKEEKMDTKEEEKEEACNSNATGDHHHHNDAQLQQQPTKLTAINNSTTLPFKFEAQVLRRGSWPIQQSISNFIIPTAIQQCINTYDTYYKVQFTSFFFKFYLLTLL